MSDQLRDALRTIKAAQERDKSPLIYLHDPDTGQPFAAMLDMDNWDFAYMDISPQLADTLFKEHSHIEGDEDEWDELIPADIPPNFGPDD